MGYKKFFERFAREERGQATIEYILILMFAIGVAGALANLLRQALSEGVLSLGAELERNIKTGRAKPDVYYD